MNQNLISSFKAVMFNAVKRYFSDKENLSLNDESVPTTLRISRETKLLDNRPSIVQWHHKKRPTHTHIHTHTHTHTHAPTHTHAHTRTHTHPHAAARISG